MNLTELTAKTLYLFGEANVGETGSPTGNVAGDQNGYELRAREWYESGTTPWGKVYRITGKNGDNDLLYADKLASFYEDAITNGFIGYETGDAYRNKLFYDLQNILDKNVSVLHENTTCDCASLCYTALNALTGVLYNETEINGSPFTPSSVSPRVRNFDNYIERQLVGAGYDIEVYTIQTPEGTSRYYNSVYDQTGIDHLTISINSDNLNAYLKSRTNLHRGDIVRTVTPATYGHIAVWL